MAIHFRAAFALSIATILAGCAGHGGTSITTPPANPYTFSGDWVAQTNGLTSVPVGKFIGALTAANGVISGTLVPMPGGSCTAVFTSPPTAVSGTVDSTGKLTITLPVTGGTATITAILGTNLNAPSTGTYQITGGTCPMTSTSMTIVEYAPVTGTYTGTFTDLAGLLGSNSSTITVSAVLLQSATPDAIGAFPVTGTVTTTGSCAVSFSLAGAYIWGGTLLGSGVLPGGSSQDLIGSFDPTAITSNPAVFDDAVVSTGCPNAPKSFGGPLTRQ